MTSSSRTPFLHIDTTLIEDGTRRRSFDFSSPSDRARERSRTLPSTISQYNPQSQKSQSADASVKTNSRALNESRKLLSHLLEQLQNRSTPPSVFETFQLSINSSIDRNLGAIVDTVRAVVKFKAAARSATQNSITAPQAESDLEDEETESVFSTNVTFDLLLRLREVLIVSFAQGWPIFHDSSSGREKEGRSEFGLLSTSFRRSRSSFQSSGRRSRSSSPVQVEHVHVQVPDLLARCISIVASIVSEDCRFKISSPRLSKPPNALQALTLDVAQFLLHANHQDPKIISQIVFALIPAFYTFGPEMHTRLLAFFEYGIVRDVLEDIRRIQGRDNPFPSSAHHKAGLGTDAVVLDSTQHPLVSIQIESADEDARTVASSGIPQWRPWLQTTSDFQRLLSTNAPRQPLSMYYLASIVTPLFAAMLESINFVPHPNTSLEALFRFYRLINTIVDSKIDSYLNLLEVIACQTPKARYAAISLLATFWPRAVGHVVVSKPLPITGYSHITGIETKLEWLNDHPYTHQFVPWRFHTGPASGADETMSSEACRCCSNAINGFGLLCLLCMAAVHLDCYDYQEGSHMFQYTMPNDSNMQKIAMHRFSYVLASRRDHKPDVISTQRHSFRLVNLFGLSLCFICRKPLWGCTAQGYKCSACLHLVHAGCIADSADSTLPLCRSNNFNDSYVSIDLSDLRRSFMNHYRDSIFSEEELKKRTYEEISVFYTIFWTQLQLLVHGIAMGTVVITAKRGNQTDIINEFELHYVVRIYEARLFLGWLTPSPVLNEYLQQNRLDAPNHHLLFDWSNLAYISSVIKSPYNVDRPTAPSSPGFLNVYQPEDINNSKDTNPHSFEMVSLSHLRDALAYEFHIYNDAAARFLLSHLHHLGFFTTLDLESILFKNETRPEHVQCSFPLPLGLDMSMDVEILVSAVEACLSDLDLSVNEVGFLLLVRKLYPDGMMSAYALRRLARSILSWVVSEDENLAIILRDYIGKRQLLPGIRSATDVLPWPLVPDSRPTPSGSTNNGGDYLTTRRVLFRRYGIRWLLAAHNQDVKLYAEALHGFCTEAARNDAPVESSSSRAQIEMNQTKQHAEWLDNMIRILAKLVHCGISFSVFDVLLLRWLDEFLSSKAIREPMPSFLRLFPEDKTRVSTTLDSTLSAADLKQTLDPGRVLLNLEMQDIAGLSRSLHCLCVIARSGVDIPVPVFFQFASLLAKLGAPLSDSLLLVEAAFSATYLKSLGRQDLQGVLSSLHFRLASHVLHCLRTRNDLQQVVRFIRQTLATCLLLYGCERSKLYSAGLIIQEETAILPSRRKLNTRGSILTDPIIVDAQLMSVLGRYIDTNVEDVSCLIAKFLNMFVNDSPYLESYEVDNFILRNGRTLCACAWHFYDIQRPDISNIRPSFLLRVLVVDPQPFQELLQACFRADLEWEARLAFVTRLFRIVLDVTSPAFDLEGRQWRSSVIDVFYYYFSTAWADEKEEIRLAVDSWSQTLLSAHFEAISLCWNESLANSPISDRVKLISFLIQLRPHFPTWKVLSWEGIIETLLQDEYEQKHGDDELGPASAHLSMYGLSSSHQTAQPSNADPEMASLRVSLVLLSLQMIADGIQIDVTSLVRIKSYLVRTVGFRESSIVPTRNGHAYVDFASLDKIPDIAFPCVSELLNVLDAHHTFNLAPAEVGGPFLDDESSCPLLVGSIFVDVVLSIFQNAEDIFCLPVLIIKNLLECLAIIIQKHDLESRPLKHLQSYLRKALKRTLELLLGDISYELRQLAMLVIQACTKQWSTLMGPILFDAVESVAKLIVMQNHQDQDLLVVQGRLYIETTVTKFSGFFNYLCKRSLSGDFFRVVKDIMDLNLKTASPLQETLREAVLRDTLTRAMDNDQDSFQPVLNNLLTYVEVVYHDNYSADLMRYVGICLTMAVRRPVEWAAETFDPTPLLLIPAILISNNKTYSRDLLVYAEAVLRTCLARFHVTAASISQLLQATSALSRKTVASTNSTGQPPLASVVTAVCEILADGLRTKTRITPSTLTCILEVLTTPDSTGSVTPSPIFQDISLAYNGVQFLQGHVWSDVHADDDLAVSMAVAKFVLEFTSRDRLILDNLLSIEQGTERPSRSGVSVRTWNILSLAALSSDKWTSILLDQLPSFSSAFSSSLRTHSLPGIQASDSAIVDINHAYIAVKLWILLARRSMLAESHIDLTRTPGNVAEIKVWNELWPVFEGLMNHFETDPQTGNPSSLTTLTCSSVTDLFLFLRQLCSPLVLEISTKTTILSRLQSLPRGETTLSKLTRAMHGLSEAPTETSLDSLVNQAAKDVVAAEKLQALSENHRKDAGNAFAQRRVVPERHRRDPRTP